MQYDQTITLNVPAAQAATAAVVGRAMDPDTGGEYSFRHPVTGYNEDGTPILDVTSLTCTTACTAAFKASALQMLADTSGQTLCGYVSQDYAARWGGMTPPSLEACQAFCEAVKLV